MASQFSRLRAFAFIDHLDEVTSYLGVGADFESAVSAITKEAGVVWLDGHSDYGHALSVFKESYLGDITPRTTVIIAGDARTNYRPAGAEVLAEIEERARAVYWLNPEPPAYWNTGDSVMRAYRPSCTAVFEVRNLRQLEHFIEKLADTHKGKQPAGR